jgi:hypothetical protein
MMGPRSAATLCLDSLFPLVRRRGAQAGRAHWLRGLFIVLVLWLLLVISG